MIARLRHIFLFCATLIALPALFGICPGPVVSASSFCRPDSIPDGDDPDLLSDDDEDQSDLRRNTVTLEDGSDILIPAGLPFLHHIPIELNGADWSDLSRRFHATDSDLFTIVNIGDSHLQADIATGHMRSILQDQRGNAGRGLISPHRIAGTNEAHDYHFTVDGRVTTSRLLRSPWQTDMGLTGVAFSPSRPDFSIHVDTKDEEGFRSLRLLHSGQITVKSIEWEGRKQDFDADYQDDCTDIFLPRPLPSVTLNIHAKGTACFFGIVLSNDCPGLYFHTIGNNGACYSSYGAIPNFAADLAILEPDLVILSLGTNEAFGKLSDDAFYAQIDALVSDICAANPDAAVLLTTPMECQRSARARRKGRRGRRTPVTYSVNSNCCRLREVILRYGRDNSVPTFDWYAAAGGDGASSSWIEHQLMSSDRIHLTRTGYLVMGNMLAESLTESLSR